MNILSLISDFMTLAGFCTLLFLFYYAIYRFINYVKTLHLIEEIQEDVLDNEFIDLLSNKPKAIKPEKHGGIYKQ